MELLFWLFWDCLVVGLLSCWLLLEATVICATFPRKFGGKTRERGLGTSGAFSVVTVIRLAGRIAGGGVRAGSRSVFVQCAFFNIGMGLTTSTQSLGFSYAC